jgi:hypothetical protein
VMVLPARMTLVASRVLGPKTSRAAAAVSNLIVEAGIRALSVLTPSNTWSVAGSTTRALKSPKALLASTRPVAFWTPAGLGAGALDPMTAVAVKTGAAGGMGLAAVAGAASGNPDRRTRTNPPALVPPERNRAFDCA